MYIFLVSKKKVVLLKYVWAFLSYLKFREEFPYVVNKRVNRQCTLENCNEKTIDVKSHLRYDVTTNIHVDDTMIEVSVIIDHPQIFQVFQKVNDFYNVNYLIIVPVVFPINKLSHFKFQSINKYHRSGCRIPYKREHCKGYLF